MWQKLKEQLPAVVLTALLVIGAAAFMVHQIAARQRAELEPLRAQNESLREQADENRRQIAATTKLLKDALAHGSGHLLQGSAEIEKINEERLARLAQVIAERVVPALPTTRSPADLEAAEDQQIDKVAGRLAENIRPVLAEAMADQKAVAANAAQASERRINELNVGLLATQAAARDALRLSREISSLYADASRDQGVVMRLLSLPASLVIDTAKLNIVGSDRTRTQRELTTKMEEIEKRLREVQSLAADSGR